MRSTFLEVNLDNISYNIKQIKKFVGNEIELMPVIKANAYGLGADSLKNVLEENKIEKVAVAIVDEAIKLRNSGFNMDIIILNEVLETEAEDIIKYNLIPAVSIYEIAEKINYYSKEKGVTTKIHIEVDTGMGRVGLKPKDVLGFVEKITDNLKNIKIEGIYTHFSSADTSKEYTLMQIEEFDKVIKSLKDNGFSFKYVHASASGGILNFKNAHYNMVRPGIAIYGYYPDESMKKILELKPAAKLKSNVVFIKEVEKGTCISYGRTFTASKKTRIATVPIGYADGIRRSLSNKGRVFINGKYAPIIGNVCMDNFMIDITEIPNVKIGDEVILWDNENILLEEIADICDTINYEILCGIGDRVNRKYIKL